MTSTCPECGALLPAETSCQAIFDTLLNLEYSDPEYGQVHLLIVACFMIQHGRYSDEALVWIEQTLRDYLEGGMTIAQVRHKAARETRPGRRLWKVNRSPGAAPLPRIAWSMTIADVASSVQDASSYRLGVEQWARLTLQEMH